MPFTIGDRMRRGTAITLLGTLLLAGCSSEAAPAAPSASPEASESYEPLSQAEWIRLCDPEVGVDPDGPECTADREYIDSLDEYDDGSGETVYDGLQGEWAEFKTFDGDDQIEVFDVRVDSADLADVLVGADDNPDYFDGDYDAPERADAHPSEGYRFVRVEYTIANNMNVPSALSLLGAVLTADKEEFGPTDETTIYTDNLSEDHDDPAGSTQNPRSETTGTFVLEIPVGSVPDAIILRDMYIGSDAEVTIQLAL